MRVQIDWMEGGREVSAYVNVRKQDIPGLIRKAESYLGAAYDDASGEWVYYADEDGRYYALDEDDMITAGASISAGVSDWYSVWSKYHGRRLGRR